MNVKFSHKEQFLETICANCKQLNYLSDMVNCNSQGYLICDDCYNKLKNKEKRNEKKSKQK